MSFLTEVADLSGSSLTQMWNYEYASDGVDDHATVHLISLPADQDVSVEAEWLPTHLPFNCCGLGGRDETGSPWLMLLQVCPYPVDDDEISPAIEFTLDRALDFNEDAEVTAQGLFERHRLIEIYSAAIPGLNTRRLDDWSTADLMRGLLVETLGSVSGGRVRLADIVDKYPRRCAFSDREHDCQGSVFDDYMGEWTGIV